MKFILLTFSLILTFACHTTKETAKVMTQEDFKLVKATKERWYGGQAGIKGVNYFIELEKLTKKDIVIDSLLVKNHWYKAEVKGENPIFITVHVNESTPPDQMRLSQPEPEQKKEVKISNEMKDKNIILYSIKGQKKYFGIQDFQSEEAQMFP